MFFMDLFTFYHVCYAAYARTTRLFEPTSNRLFHTFFLGTAPVAVLCSRVQVLSEELRTNNSKPLDTFLFDYVLGVVAHLVLVSRFGTGLWVNDAGAKRTIFG